MKCTGSLISGLTIGQTCKDELVIKKIYIVRKPVKYPHIKKAKLRHIDIAKAFGYKNVNSFRCSSAHKTMMQGVENILSHTVKD